MVFWLDYADVQLRQAEYDEVHFRNEVLGFPTALGDHVISLAELEACFTCGVLMRSAANVQPHLRDWLVAGIDWGGGGKASTAVCIGYLEPRSRHFVVVHFSKFRGREDPLHVINQVAALCKNFGVVGIGADAGNGLVNNRLLWAEYQSPHPLTAIRYAAADHTPTSEGMFCNWSVDRNRSIGHIISRAKSKHIQFPRFEQSRPFLEEFACEVAEYNDEQAP